MMLSQMNSCKAQRIRWVQLFIRIINKTLTWDKLLVTAEEDFACYKAVTCGRILSYYEPLVWLWQS